MAKALTLRQLAKIFQKQADIYSKLAKSQMDAANALPSGAQATDVQLNAALVAYDLCVRSFYTSDGMQGQADAYTQQANDAGEPP